MIRNKPSQQFCDDDRLIAVLSDGDQAAQHQEVVEHIEQCSRCQQRFDELAAGAQDWTKARQALLNDDPCSENAVGSAKWDYSLRNEGPVAWTESMASQLLSPASHPELLGRIGRYDVERLIGSGGMGVVFKAHDSELNRPVAIKILAPYLSSSGPARKRFAREARAAAAVVQEHVVPIYNVETERETPFLVMQYIAGESLQGRIDREGALELCEILRIGMQVASGLSAAHQQGLVHRDIKPSNILMEQGVERALITDFGLARAADDASLTRTGFHPGTPQYMSPEQAAGEQVDARSDLFSLGSVLYTMCTGRPPFRAETSLGVLRRITDVEPRRIREINPDISEWLCLLISRLMAKSPDARFGNALEVAALLEQCLAHVQQPTSVPLPASLVPHAAGRRSIFNSTRKGMIAMIGTIGMTLLGLVLLQATESPDISGQWTSDEWGTVVLEAKGAGEYEGTFTGSGKDKPAPSNDPPGDGPGDGPQGFGVSPKSRYDALSDSDKTKSGSLDSKSFQSLNSPPGGGFGHLGGGPGAGSVLPGAPGARPVPDACLVPAGGGGLGGNTGDTMSGPGTALDSGTSKSGTLHLKWSRVERRFNGTWGKGADRRGTMSLRLVDKEIRGGFTTHEEVQLETGTPLLGDMLWKRSLVTVTVPDGGDVLLGGTDETVPSPLKIPPGEILVDVYAGRSVWYLPEKEVDKLLHSFKSLRGVTVQVHEDGKGDAFTKAVVHDPAPVRDEPAENQKREERIRTIKISIDEALRTHKVPNVRWLDANGKQNGGPAAEGGERNETAIANSSDWEMHQVFNPAHDQMVRAVAFAPDGKTIASAAADRRVKFWDVATGALRSTMARSVNCTDVAYSPDGIYLAIAGGDHGDDPKGEVVLFDGAGDGEEFVLESHESSRYSTSVAFSPDNRWLASGGSDKMVKIWSVPQRKLHKMLADHTELVSQVVFSPNGKMLASASFDDTVRLWSVPDGDAIATLRGHKKEVRGIAFSSDSKLLVSASEDGTARVWNTSSGEQLGVMDGHGGPIFSVAFAPDGQYVATGSRGPSGVIIWDVNTRKGVSPIVLPQQKQEVESLAFSPDGQMLAIVGGLYGFQIWKCKVAGEVPEIEKPLDRQNARAVVEAFVAAAVAGDSETARTLAGDVAPARMTELAAVAGRVPGQMVTPPAMTHVYVHDLAMPTSALATSERVSRAGERDSVLLLTLSFNEGGWFVTDIEFESKEGADRKSKKFVEANPKTFSIPPLTAISRSNEPAEVLTAEQAIEDGEELIVSQRKVVVRLRVLDARITTRSGAEFVWELRSTERSVGVGRGTPFIIEVPTMVEAEHKRLGVHDLEEHYVGKLIEVEGAISQLSIPGFIGGYAIRVTSLDQIRIVDPRVPDANDQQSIRWGEPVNGLRFGAKFEGANNQDAMQFRHGDRADIQLFLQNVSDQETECGFDPVDVCKWHNSPWPDPLKQEAVEVLRIKQHNGEVVEPEPLRNSDGSRVTYIIAPLSSNYAKLLPQEIRRIDGQLGALGRTGREVPVKDFIGFHIVAQKSAEPARQHPQEYVLPSGKHTAAIAINVFKVGKQIRLECPALEFMVVDCAPRDAANPKAISVPPQAAREAAKSPTGLADMKKLRDVLLQRVVLLEKSLAAGETVPATVLTARDQLFQAELQLVTTKEERLTIHQKRLDNMCALEKVVKQLFDAKECSQDAMLSATAARLQAEIDLARVGETIPGSEIRLDRQNARAVVEAFVAAAIAGDEMTINTLAPISRSQAGVELYVGELKFLKLAKLRIESVYVNDLAKPTKALATSVEVRLGGKTPRLDEARVSFLVLTLSMSENGWSVTNIDFDSKETADRELKKFLEANPKSISVPPQGQAQPGAAHVNPLVGYWKLVELADMPVDQLAGATVVIDEHRVKMHVPSQKGPHPDWRYTLGANGDIDLVDADDVKGESIVRAKYSLKGKALYLALNAKKGDHPRPESATGEAPQEGVQFIVLESDEEAQSSEATKAPDEDHGKREGNQQGPEVTVHGLRLVCTGN